MKKVVIFADRNKESVSAAMDGLCGWLEERAQMEVDTDLGSPWTEGPVDLVVVQGGDGMMLHAARKFSPDEVPVLGINLGKFGFLTQATLDQAREILEDALEDRYPVEERMMIRCRLERNGETILDTLGLNDAVVSRSCLSRLLTLELMVGGEPVNTYRADGVIVATPVGSTAHSLAASGPILVPTLEAFVVTPICPHTLSNRPIVIPPDRTLEVCPRDYAETPALTVDGQVHSPLEEGDRVRIERAEEKLHLLRTGERTFFETLRNKLGWSGQPRYVR